MEESSQAWLQQRVDIWPTFTNWFNDHITTLLSILIFGAIAYFVGGKIFVHIVKRFVRSSRHKNWHQKDIEKREKTLAQVINKCMAYFYHCCCERCVI